jgi:hypothetical protein
VLELGYPLERHERQHRLQAIGNTAHSRPPILRSVAADDRADSGQGTLEIIGGSAVVDTGRSDTAAGRHHQREVAAHAEADYADLAGAAVVVGQPAARGVEFAERSLREPNR